MTRDHFARPQPTSDGRTPVRGTHPCAVAGCGRLVQRFGSRPHSDGGRGNWKHVAGVVLAEFVDDKGQSCVTTRRGDVISTTRTKRAGGTLPTFDALMREVFGS